MLLFVAFSAPLFYRFALNRGYGVDQLEYLVLGRALAEGVPLFTYVPSKSFAIYVTVAALYRLGVTFDPPSLAQFTTLLYVAMVCATFIALRQLLPAADRGLATLAAAAVGVCAVLMELNYLQPTGFVYLFGLGAYALTIRSLPARSGRVLFLAGMAVAGGSYFKMVALLYGAAIAVFVITERAAVPGACARLRPLLGLVVGLAVGLALPAAYFAVTGRFAEFWHWTVIFPLLHYPSNTVYLPKIYTKLGGIIILILSGLAGSLLPGVRSRLYTEPTTRLALLMGSFSYLVLFKTQASHYYFAGAPFLCFFAVTALARSAELARGAARATMRVGLLAVALCLLGTSAVLYAARLRPGTFGVFAPARVVRPADSELVTFVHRRVPPDRQLLAMHDPMRVYWLTHRYPPGRLIHTAEQSTWLFRRAPRTLLDVLDEPRLVLVEFDPEQVHDPWLDDPTFGARPGDREILAAFHERLRRDFLSVDGAPAGYQFWERRPVPTPG